MAGAVLVVGMAAAVALVALFVKDVARPLTRFTTTQPVAVELPAGAERTIYRQTGSSFFDPPLSCQVVDVATGGEVPTTSSLGFTLTLGDEEFVSTAAFRAPRPGRYRVACRADAAVPVRLAVGPRIRIVGGVARIFGAVAVVLVSVAVTAAIAVVTAVRRHQHRRRLQGLD
ncbi:MAG: hypothetical protein M3N31_07815 [Actinomycetota bacterium]|nr:hypothetical protein [Actinomycetota bacterium]